MRKYLAIIQYGKEYWGKGIVAFFLEIVANILSALSLTLIIPFLEILFSDDEPAFKYDKSAGTLDSWKVAAYDWLNQTMQSYDKFEMLTGFCIALGASFFLKNIFHYGFVVLMAQFEQAIVYNLRNAIFRRLTQLSLSFYARKRKGHILNIVGNDVEVVQQAIIGTLMKLLSDPLKMIIFIGAMLLISWKLTLFSFIILPITGFMLAKITRSLRSKARKGQEHLDRLSGVVDEFITGIRVVKSFRTEQYEIARYDESNEKFTKKMLAYRYRATLSSPLTELISVLVILTIILYGGSMILNEEEGLNGSQFIGYIALFSQFLAPIKTFAGAISRVQKAVVSFDRIQALTSEPVLPTEQSGGKPVDEFRDKIEIRGLSFQYNDTPVLKDIHLEIPKGSMVALVGPSGGGKTTLADLVCRFYDPVEGQILLDGKPLTDLQVSDYRSLLGVVSQDGALFNDTVRNNIAYGLPDVPMEDIIAAAKVANAHEFISDMEDGYDTVVGERGARLSGGQKQRLAIARAVLKNPPILVLDEATSALDNESEKIVQEALDNLMKQRTSIVIAHRLSTILHADKIVVLENGRIVGQGPHDELLETTPLYRELYNLQFR